MEIGGGEALPFSRSSTGGCFGWWRKTAQSKAEAGESWRALGRSWETGAHCSTEARSWRLLFLERHGRLPKPENWSLEGENGDSLASCSFPTQLIGQHAKVLGPGQAVPTLPSE